MFDDQKVRPDWLPEGPATAGPIRAVLRATPQDACWRSGAVACLKVGEWGGHVAMSADPAIGWKIVTGILAVATATFASQQTFLKLDERANLHKRSGARSTTYVVKQTP